MTQYASEADMVEAELHELESELSKARAAVIAQNEANKRRKQTFDLKVKAFVSEAAPRDHATLVRQQAAADAELKQAIKDGRVQPHEHPGLSHMSTLDRHAYFARGGDADDHARSMHRVGFRRGYVDPRTGRLVRAHGQNMVGQRVF